MAMIGTNDKAAHPGFYVRQQIIPKGMTVTKAAALLGVGRPALSNFLNGKAALSPRMALRLERTFHADREALLNLQARFARRDEAAGRSVVAGAHAPTLVSIKAKDIDRWADEIEARQELPALLRLLVHSTGRDLTRVDFPAYDNAERPGWDGTTETPTPTPWIPNGRSGWEFGCSQGPRAKAQHDYAARMESVLPEERRESSFVFVTPRNWREKGDWAAKKNKLGHWKDVRAYDASDLEQWLEQSAPTQIWFAERLNILVSGYRSLDRCWSDWAEACDPALSPVLFDQVVEDSSVDFKGWLNKPPKHPYIINADSRDEALAFLCCLIGKAKSDADGQDAGVVVFDTPDAARRFDASATVPRIAVAHDQEVEREIGCLCRRCHCVIVRPGNDVNAEPDIRLGLLGQKDFADALKEMGLPEDRVERLAQESARSPTILRRRLSNVPAIQAPAWTGDAGTAQKLLPATLVGAWHNASPADREIVRLLAKADDYSDVESNIAALLTLDDPPVWSAGEYRGVVSRIDALFGIAAFVTKSDLENFIFVAECVLSETDPALELPDNKQWMAAVYGKARAHSGALRRGIRETLILMAVFGGRLFRQRTGFDPEPAIASLVHKLLAPLDREKILSLNDDLPDYAEAAPEVFLSLFETDLQQARPFVQELMRPAVSTLFDSPRRINLLWALEGLAWTPSLFPRVVEVLSKLCTMDDTDDRDNWVNRPENTLESLFRSWLPQTAASFDERVRTFEKLCHDYPEIGWRLCISQLGRGGSFATPNHRPRWRDDTATAGRKSNDSEDRAFVLKAIDVALNWPCHDENTLVDLVEQLEWFPEDDQLRIWNLIDQWADSTSSEDAKEYLRQRIHGYAHLRYRMRKRLFHVGRERSASKKLLPTDLVTRYAWLFKSHWVELPPDDAESGELDYEKNNQRLYDLRLEAVRQIWKTRGFKGVEALLDREEDTSQLVGKLIAETLAWNDESVGFVKQCLHAAVSGEASRYQSCLAGFLWNADSDYIAVLFAKVEHDPDTLLTLLLCLPYGTATWQWLDDKAETFRNAYWRNVEPQILPGCHAEEEVNRSIDELLAVNRGGTAFTSVCMMWDKVETFRLKKLLTTLAASLDELPNHNMTGYHLSTALDELDKRSGISVDEKATLEFSYLTLLDRTDHGIPNLEEQIAKSPELYVQAITCCCGRADGTEDPTELGFDDRERYKRIASNVHGLLQRMRRIPGTDPHGEINPRALKKWLRQVRDLCELHDRSDAGDRKIGELLARAPVDADGVWPCRPVCEALEWMASEQIGRGFELGALESRGAVWRGTGGDQERELAAYYRGQAHDLVHEFPYVGSVLECIASSYDREAGWWDDVSNVRERLPYF